MKRSFRHDKKAVSSVFMAVFIAIMVMVLGLSLLTSLEIGTSSSIQKLKLAQTRNQESILVQRGSITIVNDIIQSIRVNNTGSILSRISGVYIDSQFVANPGIYVNSQGSATIDLSGKAIPYSKNKFSSITITTERGTSFTSTIVDLEPASTTLQGTVYGPLRLMFDEFHWTYHKDNFDSNYLRSAKWNPGWLAPGNAYVIWRIRVQNVDDQAERITIGKYSAISIIANEGINRQIFFIDQRTSDFSIKYREYATLYFVWSSPDAAGRTQSYVNKLPADQHSMTFLIMHGKIGDTIFGETIPFEATLTTK